VRYAAWRAPGVEVAYLKDVTDAADKRAFIAKARRIGARAVSAHWLAIDEAFVTAAHDAGLRAYSWHAGHELTSEKLRAGLDGLITDFPREARARLEGQ
jgi:glycerophosphoryl diester phosphodiesterase